MRTFREHALNELKMDSKSYQKFSTDAIKNVNMMIEYGRKVAELDNKQLNPLLDCIKNIHAGEDAIRIAISTAAEELDNRDKENKNNKKKAGDKQW